MAAQINMLHHLLLLLLLLIINSILLAATAGGGTLSWSTSDQPQLTIALQCNFFGILTLFFPH